MKQWTVLNVLDFLNQDRGVHQMLVDAMIVAQCARMFGYEVLQVDDEFVFTDVNSEARWARKPNRLTGQAYIDAHLSRWEGN